MQQAESVRGSCSRGVNGGPMSNRFEPQDWPSELNEVLLHLMDEWDVASIERRKTISDGRSGAHVFIINLDARPLNGQAVLKVAKKPAVAGTNTTSELDFAQFRRRGRE